MMADNFSDPMRDKALEEIWEARRRVWEEAGGTWDGYMARLKEIEEEFERNGGVVLREPLRTPLPPDYWITLHEDPPA